MKAENNLFSAFFFCLLKLQQNTLFALFYFILLRKLNISQQNERFITAI